MKLPLHLKYIIICASAQDAKNIKNSALKHSNKTVWFIFKPKVIVLMAAKLQAFLEKNLILKLENI